MPETAVEFEELLLPQLNRAYSVALGLCHAPSEAENLVQEASFRAFRSFATFHKGTNFRAWFLRILTHCYFETCRSRKRHPETLEDEEELDQYLYRRSASLPGADPVESLFHKLTGQQISQAIAQLPEDFRLVATLYFQEDMSYLEIAEITQIPLGTVRSRIHRGRKLLQKALWQLALEQGLVAAKESG